MKVITILLLVGLLSVSVCSFAQEAQVSVPTAQSDTDGVGAKYTINPKFTAHEIINYKIDTTIRQENIDKKAADDKGMPLNADYHMVLRHKYASRESSDKLLPLEVKAVSCEITYQGQSMNIAPDMQTLSLLVDNNFFIKNIFGLRDIDLSVKNPGVTYPSLIMFFFSYGTSTPRAIGETWEVTAPLPTYNQNYKFKNKLVAIESIDGIQSAKIEQKVGIYLKTKNEDGEASEIISPYDVAAVTNYSLEDGRLVRSAITVKNKDENPITMTYTISRQLLHKQP